MGIPQAGDEKHNSCVLEHSTLEVLVLTYCWGGDRSFALRYMTLASSVPLL